MRNGTRTRVQKLMRWYPRSWRDENEAVFVDTLGMQATRHAGRGLSQREGWSIRAHGLAARATPRVLTSMTTLAVAFSAAPLVSLWFAMSANPGPAVLLIAAPFAAALLLSVVIGARLVRGGVLEPEPAILAGVTAVPAWVLGALAAASWSVGFDEADSGGSRSWFGDAFLVFLVAAWIAGAISVALVIAASLRRPVHLAPRVLLAVIAAIPTALLIGAVAALPAGSVLLSAAVLVHGAITDRPPRVAVAVRRPQRRPLDAPLRSGLAAGAIGMCLIGLACVAFALTGSVVFPSVGDSTRAMQLGILGGSLIALTTVAIGSVALRARFGNSILWPSATIMTALGLVAVSYAVGVNGPWGWPLLIGAALLAGLTGGLLFRPLLPQGMLVQAVLVAGISVALATSLGLPLVTMAAFAAPLLAAAIAVLLLRRPRRRTEPGGRSAAGLDAAAP